ncbi:MAG: ATP-dependent protease ATPase subunit HslU [Firmicutes bacterium]|nr:ATP-dependent protease ATPase subunit HslU [Bacillota bacterium]
MELTPKQIVAELDRYIIGQTQAKKAVAVALRNRYRRSQLTETLRDEVTPKNIIMKGPTGVGKTEIARRLAKIVKAPFIKVEATKFTEVGYVGRDVESMVRDLAETAVRLVKEEKMAEVEEKARTAAEKKIVEALYSVKKQANADVPEKLLKEQILSDVRAGKEDGHLLEIDVADAPKPVEMVAGSGMEINMNEILGNFMPKRRKKRKMTVKEALKVLVVEESEKFLDPDSINAEGLKRAEQAGIIFIDEIDKIAAKNSRSAGPDVSREGVQRDILPIVEGSTVQTKYGALKTDYMLFIASGAFHIAEFSDLIPELQGRFPVLAELSSLTKDDFKKILTTPENAIVLQYTELLKVDSIDLVFTEDAIDEIAQIAADENEDKENIGARRLHTIMERLLEDLSYNAGGDHPMTAVTVDRAYVSERLGSEKKKHDLKKYIL